MEDHALFTLDVSTTNSHGIELEIDLAAGSLPFYYLPEGPVQLKLAPADDSSKPIWTKIQATGRLEVTTRGTRRELSPPLIFQAKVENGQNGNPGLRKVSPAVVDAVKRLEEEDTEAPD